MRVLKFGGTSVADAERFETVAEITLNSSAIEQVALVLSAPARVTNLLVALVTSATAGDDGSREMEAVRAIVEPIISGLAARYPQFDAARVTSAFTETMNLVKRRVEGIRLLGQCPDKVAAFIESRGESFSIAIMAELLSARGMMVKIIDPVKILVTEGPVMESSVNIEASKLRFARTNIDPGTVVLMSGFIGGDSRGDLVLLGRNGSDYSAACLAAVAGASRCEIWTDVEGVYSCDPRLVNDALLLRRMSYKEAMELSYFGAKVLHPRTIAPIARFQIPCLIKNTLNPDGAGTLINESSDLSVPIKGITDLSDVALINVSGPGMKGMVGMAGRLFTAVSRAEVSVLLITQSSSEYSISFCIRSEDLSRARQAIENEFVLELREGVLDPVEITPNCAVISVVGDGMRTMCGTSGRFFRALAVANINVSAIAQGSSERSISAVIAKDKAKAEVAVCHTAFFNTRQILELVVVGCGGIGGELLRQISRQADLLRDAHGLELRVVAIGDKDHFICDAAGISLDSYRQMLDSSPLDFSLDRVRTFVSSANLVNPVFVDCTADERVAFSYCDMMRLGMHVVTPSKKANTGSYEYYMNLRHSARRHHRRFMYEANVGAGLPVINTLQNELAAGDRLIEFSGIMSGTLSYIFGLVEDGYTLSQATIDAYEKGYSEPNPGDDLLGMDVARKLLILARECGYRMELDDVQVESVVDPELLRGRSAKEVLETIKDADPVFCERARAAREDGRVLRYVGEIKDGVCRCSVQAVDASSPLFKVRGGENALAFTTAYYQPIPLVIRGYGAGAAVTAAGVLADILRLQHWTREG